MRDAAPPPLRFDQFELDESNARLTQRGRPIQLPPKAFAVLCTLARQPGKLITKSALLDAVWGHQHVSESVLKTTISQVRAALSDDASRPMYIETASRRGYRFIGNIGATPAAAAQPAVAETIFQPAPASPAAPMIGRRTALAKMQAAWQVAAGGKRQTFWIAGEAGVGKTTLIDHFTATLGPVLVAHGQCVEQFGSGEPYLPVLEALGSLCRRDETLPQMMRAIAPTWLLQLPWLSSEADRLTLHRELVGANQDRMVRELAELLERYTEKQPLLFITEDLHWSDHATLRLMDHFARRRNPIHVMWLVSFRLTQVIAEEHPLQQLRQELRLHRLCEEVVLDPFSEREVAEYIESRVPGKEFPEAFVHRLHAHTDGLPLFVVNVLDTLAAEGATEAPEKLPLGKSTWKVPENLAGAIELQISRLPQEVQAMLETASACGMEFRASTLADVLEQDAHVIGERCDELVRRQYWLRHIEVTALADGTLDTRYAFSHALYRHVFHQRLGASARVQLHRRVAIAMERSRTRGIAIAATELASQYEAGLVYASALRHYADATRSALTHFAPREAADLAAHALTLLPKLPEGQERMELELALVANRGVACSQQFGLASHDAQIAYERAQALCDVLPPAPERAQVLSGLGWMLYVRGEYAGSRRIAERVLELSKSSDDPMLFIMGCGLKGVTQTMQAEYASARETLDAGIAAFEAAGESLPSAAFVSDPLVVLRTNISVACLHLGQLDRARSEMTQALTRARRVGQPMALVIALWCSAMLEMRLKHPERVAEHAAELSQIVADRQIFQAMGPSRWVRGWAESYLGSPGEGLRLIMEGFEFNKHLGMISGGSEVLGYAVESLLLARDWDGAQAKLDDASELARRLGERILFPYHFMLQARIHAGRGNTTAAKQSLREGLVEVAAQQTRWMDLRLRIELCEFPDRTAEDLAGLAATYGKFTDGLDVHLCVRAREILAGQR